MRPRPTRARNSHVSCRAGAAGCAGAFLLEALVALGVFSVGMLGLLVLLAGALRASGGAQWRSEGFDIAAAALARMWTEDAGTLAARYDAAADGAGYRGLLAQAMRLPGVTPAANAPRVVVDDTAGARRIRVTVRWQLPSDAVVHQASVTAVLPHP
jgi:type IV pilus assembly protein PilV